MQVFCTKLRQNPKVLDATRPVPWHTTLAHALLSSAAEGGGKKRPQLLRQTHCSPVCCLQPGSAGNPRRDPAVPPAGILFLGLPLRTLASAPTTLFQCWVAQGDKAGSAKSERLPSHQAPGLHSSCALGLPRRVFGWYQLLGEGSWASGREASGWADSVPGTQGDPWRPTDTAVAS